jgi:bzd-type benzoyl-CoA reductase N subunit
MESLKSIKNILSTKAEAIQKWKSQYKAVIGWDCSYTPEEIIYAAKALPIRVFGSMESTKLADAYCPRNMCSFARSCFDLALKGEYDFLDGFVVSRSCDNREKMFDFWKRYVKTPNFYFINTPHVNNEQSLAFFYDEIVRFKEWLENTFKTAVSNESLRNAIQIFNENRRLLRKLYDLKMKEPPLLSGVETLEIVFSSMMMPKEEHNQLLKDLLENIENREDSPKSGVRILVSGSVMDNTALFKLIESLGGNIVADDLSTGTRYFWNLVEENGEPIKAIAKRYLGKVPCPFTYQSEERFKHILNLVKNFNVEAVIIFVLKFCDTHLFDAPLLTEELKKSNIPVLYLEWDHSISGIAQLKTRIEAFLEMIRN